MESFYGRLFVGHEHLGALDPLHDRLIAGGRECGEDRRGTILKVIIGSRTECLDCAIHEVCTCSPMDMSLDTPWYNISSMGIDTGGMLDWYIGVEDSTYLLALDED